MQYNHLKLQDKPLFDRYMSRTERLLSAYAFENIFIWRDLYDIFWGQIDKNLCVFFKDRVGCFLYLPPLGDGLDEGIIRQCFKTMDGINKNRIISRIENVNAEAVDFYSDLGYTAVLGGYDYICRRWDLAGLKGSSFKKKRSEANYFEKNYDFKYMPYKNTDKAECLALFRRWMRGRKAKYNDTIYHKLLDDNLCIFKTSLKHYNKLNLLGRVIKVSGRIKAATFGYPLGEKGFVILFEVCDLSYRGIAQCIFREFCRELNYAHINIMDDSGLENLKKTKLSYRPHKKESNFIIRYG